MNVVCQHTVCSDYFISYRSSLPENLTVSFEAVDLRWIITLITQSVIFLLASLWVSQLFILFLNETPLWRNHQSIIIFHLSPTSRVNAFVCRKLYQYLTPSKNWSEKTRLKLHTVIVYLNVKQLLPQVEIQHFNVCNLNI